MEGWSAVLSHCRAGFKSLKLVKGRQTDAYVSGLAICLKSMLHILLMFVQYHTLNDMYDNQSDVTHCM